MKNFLMALLVFALAFSMIGIARADTVLCPDGFAQGVDPANRRRMAEKEHFIRRKIMSKIDKLIAELLDRYDDLPNDLKGDDEALDRLFAVLDKINQYLERD